MHRAEGTLTFVATSMEMATGRDESDEAAAKVGAKEFRHQYDVLWK